MANNRIKFDIPKFAVERIKIECIEYNKRKAILEDVAENGKGKRPQVYLDEIGRINKAVKDALDISCEEPLQKTFLADIVDNRGYNYSALSGCMSSEAYKARKRKFFYAAAVLLHIVPAVDPKKKLPEIERLELFK